MSTVGNQENKDLQLPKRIERLRELANNLWWSWNEEGRQVFRSLDYALWRTSGHNPVKQLADVSPSKLEAAAKDPTFLELYDSVMLKFDTYMSGGSTWWKRTHSDNFQGQIAYFSAEYAIHNSLPIYAGGLGVLAGDICKESSDLDLPLVGIGFMYPQGYFRQRISADGWQQEIYSQLNFYEAPISPCAWPAQCGPLVPVQIADRQLYVKVWQVKVGRVKLYLLDTNVDENVPVDRALSARLYTPDPDERIRQLLVLGIGGVKVLRELHLEPSVWHANEDHTAFMMLERLREELIKGLSWEMAIEKIRASSIFTTHTPVGAGSHVFPVQMVDYYCRRIWESAGIDRDSFLKLGYYNGLEPGKFSLSAFALRMSSQANAVSKLHGEVARRMWKVLYPNRDESQVPISYVTNGVHLPTWQAPEIVSLCRTFLGSDILERQDDQVLWNCAANMPDEEFWEVHQTLKARLIRSIRERAERSLTQEGASIQQVPAMGALLDPYALTIVFARRFAEYKRPYLILTDLVRLKNIVNNPLWPVQIVFAGKSHPADFASKELLKRVYSIAMDRSFLGRIAFVEDYDMSLARDLVRGADVWLNNPRRLQEASGTSGMKASMNGVINASVLDGWWYEGYNGSNGWPIEGFKGGSPSDEDRADAEALYRLLENDIVPLYYDRDRKGVPHRWIQIAKAAIGSVSPVFNASRMMKEYTEKMYIPAALASKLTGEISVAQRG